MRRLYANTVNAVALYGVPVWAEAAIATRFIKDTLQRIQRHIAIKVVRGYRTVSHAAASVLAGLPPMELTAQMYAETHQQVRGFQRRNIVITARIRGIAKVQARQRLLERWGDYLATVPQTRSGQRAVMSERPR